MRRFLAGFLVLAAPWIASATQRDSSSSRNNAALDEFVRAHVERREAPPFAFTYDGKPSSASLAM